MNVIITFTFCCDNLSKSKVYGSGISLEDLEELFFFYFMVSMTICYWSKGVDQHSWEDTDRPGRK